MSTHRLPLILAITIYILSHINVSASAPVSIRVPVTINMPISIGSSGQR